MLAFSAELSLQWDVIRADVCWALRNATPPPKRDIGQQAEGKEGTVAVQTAQGTVSDGAGGCQGQYHSVREPHGRAVRHFFSRENRHAVKTCLLSSSQIRTMTSYSVLCCREG